MMNTLPIFDIKLDEFDPNQGVSMVSLVDVPAIGVDWFKMSKEEIMNIAFAAKKDKQILYGPMLIPNKLIERFSDKIGGYYIRFSEDEIEKIANRFNSDLNGRKLNFQHMDIPVEGYIAENWLTDGETDKSKRFGFELPRGTWFGGIKINDSDFWNTKVKSDKVKGFSVEILSNTQLALSIQKINEHMNENDKIELAAPAVVDENKVATEPAVVTDEATPVVESTIKPLTGEEVSQMIDMRLSSFMDEITSLKKILETIQNKPVEEVLDAEGNVVAPKMVTMSKEDIEAIVNEKLASIPGVGSVTKPEPVIERIPKTDSDFNKQVEILRKRFAK